MGRRQGITQNEARVRQHLAEALNAAIGPNRGACAAAALKAGVTKQALSLYMRQKATPGTETLRRLCAQLNLKLNIEGALITGTLSIGDQGHPEVLPKQLSMFDAIASVDESRLHIDVLRKAGDRMELKVSIDFGAPDAK